MSPADQQLGYALLRATMGVNLLGHGLARIPKLGAFHDWMVEVFANAPMPSWTVSVFASVLPFIELLIGALLLVGLLTRRAAVAGAVLMLALVLGSCLVEKWEWVGVQMVYALVLYLLIVRQQDNAFALDTWRARSSSHKGTP